MPSLAPTLCKCGYVKMGNEKCPRCTKQTNKDYNKESRDMVVYDTVYNTTRWRELRQIVLKRSKGLCELCFKQNRIEKADVVDHKVEVSDDNSLAFDLNNLQSLCHSCHNKKTALEAKKRQENTEK